MEIGERNFEVEKKVEGIKMKEQKNIKMKNTDDKN